METTISVIKLVKHERAPRRDRALPRIVKGSRTFVTVPFATIRNPLDAQNPAKSKAAARSPEARRMQTCVIESPVHEH